MKGSTSLSEARVDASQEDGLEPEGPPAVRDRVAHAVYAAALAISIALWFLAIRAPLDLDETGSYWQICAGFSNIWHRQFLFPSCLTYSYVLWFWSKLFGIGEIALRVPSLLAMLGAVYLLYRNARSFFDRDIALFAAVIFSLEPAILFASIDIRPYAFGALAINAALFILFRLRHSHSNWLAALLGLSAACIVWFQLLFAVLLPILVLCFFALKVSSRKTVWRQFGVALAAFTLAFLPALPGFLYLLSTRGTHVFGTAPDPFDLLKTLAPNWLLPIFLCLAPVSLLIATFSARQRNPDRSASKEEILLCVSLGLIPVLILYVLSVATPIHVFVPRYCMVAAPGIALCWALILGCFRSRAVRLLFCIVVVAMTSVSLIRSSNCGKHDFPMKYVLAALERNASVDHAPVLICSGFIESDYAAMPIGSVKTSPLFAPLSYYPLSVPVVPLPRDLNNETVRVVSLFLRQAAPRHQRFLATEHFGVDFNSYGTLDWLKQRASADYTFRKLGVVDGFEILEFLPIAQSSRGL